MVSSTKKRNEQIKKTIIGLLVLAGIICAVWYFFIRKPETGGNETETRGAQPETVTPAETTEASEPASTETAETPKSEEVDPKAQVQNEGENPNNSETLTGVLTRSDIIGDKLIIRVNIDQYLSGGVCELSLTSSARSYSDTANIVDSASTSTCEGFDVPTSKLAAGNWTISIKLTSGDKEGTISGKVSI